MIRRLKALFVRDPNIDAHKAKNKYTAEMIEVQGRAREQLRHTEEIMRTLKESTAYKIAVATGARKRGLH